MLTRQQLLNQVVRAAFLLIVAIVFLPTMRSWPRVLFMLVAGALFACILVDCVRKLRRRARAKED